MKKKQTTLFILLFCMSISLFGQIKQQPTQQVLLEMRDSSVIKGILVAKQGDTLVVETKLFGTLSVKKKDIKTMEIIEKETPSDVKKRFENLHAIHNFVSPTGIGLRKGEGYYNNTYLFLNTGAYGFSKNFSLGLTLMPRQLFFVATPKLSFRVANNFSLGICGAVGFVGYGPLLGGYGVATIGNRDHNLSIGVGSGISGEYELKSPFFFSINGQIRLARKVSLITENYILQGHLLGVTGFRFMNAKSAFNLGIIYPFFPVFDSGSPFPFLGFGIPFKIKKKGKVRF